MKVKMNDILRNVKAGLHEKGPELMIISGTAGLVTSAVLACRASTKIQPIMDEFYLEMKRLDVVYAAVPDDPEDAAEQKKFEKKERRKAYRTAIAKLAKLYGLPLGLGTASIVSILCGAGILKKRHAALAAAYATLDESYREYRRRVEEKYGEDAEKEIRYGTHKEEITVTEADENGEEHEVTKEVDVIGGAPSDYMRYFTPEYTVAAEPNPDYNEMFLKTQEQAATRILRGKGFLYLNDVYEMLGFDRSVAGQEVGWVYDPSDEDHGDNIVDFRIEAMYAQKTGRPGEWEKIFTIDPNVDGSITAHLLKLGLIKK